MFLALFLFNNCLNVMLKPELYWLLPPQYMKSYETFYVDHLPTFTLTIHVNYMLYDSHICCKKIYAIYLSPNRAKSKSQGNNSFNSLLITLVFLLISCKDDILQNTNILPCDLCLTNFVDYFLFLFIFLPYFLFNVCGER